jgi:hypothetical protein
VQTSWIFVTACVLFDTPIIYGTALLPALRATACLLVFFCLSNRQHWRIPVELFHIRPRLFVGGACP